MHTLLPDVCLWECVDPRWGKGGAAAVKFRCGRISDRRPRRSGQAGHVALGATNTGLQGGVLGRAIFGDFEDSLRTLGGPRACGGEALHPGAGRTPSRARVPIAVLLTSLEDGSCTWAWGSIRGQAGKGGSATEVAAGKAECCGEWSWMRG